MIKDNLQNLAYYNYFNPDIKFGLKYVRDTDFSALENGKYELVEGKIYANIQEYITKPEAECQYETHKKYVDIQFMIKGEEKIGTGKIEDFEETSDYDEEKDIVFLSCNDESKVKVITLKEREYAIFMPNDVHMPSLQVNEPSSVRKVVVKVLV